MAICVYVCVCTRSTQSALLIKYSLFSSHLVCCSRNFFLYFKCVFEMWMSFYFLTGKQCCVICVDCIVTNSTKCVYLFSLFLFSPYKSLNYIKPKNCICFVTFFASIFLITLKCFQLHWNWWHSFISIFYPLFSLRFFSIATASNIALPVSSP